MMSKIDGEVPIHPESKIIPDKNDPKGYILASFNNPENKAGLQDLLEAYADLFRYFAAEK
jgi:hypothetical protein